MKRYGLRWIPLALGLICALAVAWIWNVEENQRQDNVLLTMAFIGGTVVLMLLWVLFLSGFRWKSRFVIIGTAGIACGLAAGLARIDGFTGDIVPILAWRFSPLTDPALSQEVPHTPRVDVRAAESFPWREYPQFLGPERNGKVGGVRLARDWKANPPREVWRRQIGAAWSGFAVAAGRAFTQEQRGEKEMVTCYDLATGELRWAHSDVTRYETPLGGIGPRATPTVTDDRVFALGATGMLNCLDRYTGKRVWGRDAVEENGAKVNSWGMSGSPLVYKNLVIVSIGGKDNRSLIAYEKDRGELVWHGGNDPAGYSSPFVAILADVPQVIIFNQTSVAAHHPASGAILWRQPWSGEQQIAQPVPVPGDRVLVSSGYGVGCALFQISGSEANGFQVTQVWKTRSLKAKFANFVHRDGFVYGVDDGILVCVDIDTGKRRWKRGRYGHGQMILVEDLLVVMAESGEVALVEPVPDEFRELARFPALGDKTWNSPALAAPYLLVRNDREAACYELPLDAPLAK